MYDVLYDWYHILAEQGVYSWKRFKHVFYEHDKAAINQWCRFKVLTNFV